MWTQIPNAIWWAVDHGAKVINISGGGQLEAGGWEAVQDALGHDVLVVASTGDAKDFPGRTAVIEPASFPGVLAVTAVNRDGKVWDGALHGPQTVLAAPGVDIPMVCAAGGGRVVGYYESTSGTGNAAAIVSGAAALIRAKYPELPARDVVQRLIATADDAGAPGRDPEYGVRPAEPGQGAHRRRGAGHRQPAALGRAGAPDDDGEGTFAGAFGDAMTQLLTVGAVWVGVLLLVGLILLLTRRRRT